MPKTGWSKPKITVVDAGFIGLRSRNNSVVLECGATGSLPASLKTAIAKHPVVHENREHEDVRFLYVIPWIPQTESEEDDYHKAVLAERVKVTAAEIVDRARVGRDVYIRTTEILAKLLDGVEKFWKNTPALTQCGKSWPRFSRSSSQNCLATLPRRFHSPTWHGLFRSATKQTKTS